MKHIIKGLSLITLTAALYCCTQDDGMDYWSFATGNQEIEFTPNTDLNTKDVISGTTYPSDVPFAVTAWYLGTETSYSAVNKKWDDYKTKSVQNGGAIQYIPNLNTTGSGVNASMIVRTGQTYWKNPYTKFYWPAAGSLTFFIYSPYYSLVNDSIDGHSIVSCTPDRGLTISRFDATPKGGRLDEWGNPVPEGNQWNVDFMATPILKNYTKDSIGTAINAVFKHQLSTIQFSSKRSKDLSDDVVIYLKEIKLKRILSVASYSMTNSDSAIWSRKGNFDDIESEYVIFRDTAGLELTSESVVTNTLMDEHGPILVIPQELPYIPGAVNSDNATIIVTYSKKAPVPNPLFGLEDGQDSLITQIQDAFYYGDFKSIIGQWKPGKSYTYSLSIGGLETIHWDPSVTQFSYESKVLRPLIFDKTGNVSDQVILSLVKQDTVNKYNGSFSKYGNYNFQVNEDCQSDIRDNLYFMWYKLRRPKQDGDKWSITNSGTTYSYNWFASIEKNSSGAYYVKTDQQMDPYSLFKQVCGSGASPYNTNSNCRNSVVFQLKRCSRSNSYYIYHPATDTYLSIDFSKASNGVGNTDCASFVPNISSATPLSIDFLGLYQDNKQYDNTTDGVQIYYDSYTDNYYDNGNIISKSYNAETGESYYVLGVNMSRTFYRNYITFDNGTISFQTVSSTPVSIEKQYLYITKNIDMEMGWRKAHEEVGKLLNKSGSFDNITIDQYNCSALMNLIPLNGTVKTEQQAVIDDDDVLSDFELRNIHGNTDTYGSSGTLGEYHVKDIITVRGDVFAKVNGNGPCLVEKNVILTANSIISGTYGKIQDNGTISVVAGGNVDGQGTVECNVQLKNHSKYGSITPTGANYKFKAFDRISYALSLNEVVVETGESVTAKGTVYYVYNGVTSSNIAASPVDVIATATVDSNYAKASDGKITGEAEGFTTYSGKYTYKDASQVTYNLTATEGTVKVNKADYTLTLDPVEITVYYPLMANITYSKSITGAVYKNGSPVTNYGNVDVTITAIGNTALASGSGNKITANLDKKNYGTTTYSASYDYNGKTLSASENLTIHAVEYSLVGNTIYVLNEKLNLLENPATGKLTTYTDGIVTSGPATVDLTVSSLKSNQTIATLSSNTITAHNKGKTNYSYQYQYSSGDYKYKFSAQDGVIDVQATIDYSLTLSAAEVSVNGNVTPKGTLHKIVNGEEVGSTPVDVYATNTANNAVATCSNGQLVGKSAGNKTSYSARYSDDIVGTVTCNNGANVSVISSNNYLWQNNSGVTPVWNTPNIKVTFVNGKSLRPYDKFYIECQRINSGSESTLQVQAGENWVGSYEITTSGVTTIECVVPSWANGSLNYAQFAGNNVKVTGVYIK